MAVHTAAGRSRRGVAVAIGAIAAVALLGFALVFTNSYGAARVAENSRAQLWTNATAGAASIVRASNAQAVVFAIDYNLGVADAGALERARAEADLTLIELRRWRTTPTLTEDLGGSDVLQRLDRFLQSTNEVLAAIDAGDVDRALSLNGGETQVAYADLATSLSELQILIGRRIDDTEAVAGFVGGLTRAIVTLLIPAAALIVYRALVKRQAENRRVELEAKLAAEQHLRKSKDEFIASISHEIRTPLTSIYGFSEVLIDTGLVDPEMSTELVGLIHHESGELSRMVEDLLTAARLDAAALHFSVSAVDVEAAVESVLAPMRRNGTDLTVSVEPGAVLADSLRMRQVIRNLVSNAQKHGGPGISVVGMVDGDAYALEVRDDGPGVPEEIESRLFERFIHRGTVPLLVGSVGLGLAVAHSIVMEMGGSLSYERRGTDTVFTVRLPIAATGTAGTATRPPSHVMDRGQPAGLDVAAIGADPLPPDPFLGG